MPTRKLSDLPRQYCTDREHEVPSHQVFDNGLYEHECPSCGNKIRFTVNKPTCAQIDNAKYGYLDEIASMTGISRTWSPRKTDECPVEDYISGGYCESDEQLRQRLRNK